MIGIHHDITAARYHADDFGPVPTLSSSIAKRILSRTERHGWVDHPRLNPGDESEDEPKFDLGSAAHELILGAGGGIDVHHFADWRTKEAKAARLASREAGKTPMLIEQYRAASKVATAAHDHPLVKFSGGYAETVLVWEDIGGPLCRAMLDHWDSGPIITDVKTTEVALTDASLARLIVNLGYDLSAGFYIRGLTALRPDLAGRVRFRWLFVETSEPFGTRLIEATSLMRTIGDRKAALAIAKWQRCLRTGEWPAWSARLDSLEMPPWYESQQMEREMADEDATAAVFMDHAPPRPAREMVMPV